MDYDLQSVIDEYVHVLLEADGQTDASPTDEIDIEALQFSLRP